jgi:hypothetical protein
LQLLQEGFIPEAFEEFMGVIDRRRAWDSHTGRYLHWLLCGPSGQLINSSPDGSLSRSRGGGAPLTAR